jgi:Fe-S-cluster containining protein
MAKYGKSKMPLSEENKRKSEYSCSIHETKPEICRDFPELDRKKVTGNEEECIEWNCKGYQEWKKKP